MKSSAWLWTVCAVALGGAAHLGAGRAAAQECASDDDCAAGLICKSFGTTSCARPAIDCVGDDCPEPEPCEEREIKACALPGCETDDDCPSGTVCHSSTYERCSASGGSSGAAPACPDDADCDLPAEPPCEDPECREKAAADIEVVCEEVTSEPVCTPVWQLPCTESADCGPGFTCEERVIGWCRGSSGGGTPGDGADPLPPEEQEAAPAEPECGEEPTGEFYCKPIATECSTDDDCEAGWSCEGNPERAVCDSAGSGGSGGGDSGGFAPPADDERRAETCGTQSTDPAKVCMPPYYGASPEAARDGLATAGESLDDASGAPPRGGEEGENASDGEDSQPGDLDGASANSSGGGCTVSAGESARGSLVTLLGLLGVCALLRRRARKA